MKQLFGWDYDDEVRLVHVFEVKDISISTPFILRVRTPFADSFKIEKGLTTSMKECLTQVRMFLVSLGILNEVKVIFHSFEHAAIELKNF